MSLTEQPCELCGQPAYEPREGIHHISRYGEYSCIGSIV
jgi:hypothetical protein